MEETILVGDDLMLGPPSPIIPPDIASHVLEGVDLCDGILRNLFLCKCMSYITNISCLQCNCFYCTKITILYVSGLQINDIEPFCQDEIVLYRQCAEKRVSFIGKTTYNRPILVLLNHLIYIYRTEK
jgi:hypothetical protein